MLTFEMLFLNYRLDLRVDEDIWIQSKAFGGAVPDQLTPHEIRTMYSAPAFTRRDAGWHFSYLSPRGGTALAVQRNLDAFSHQEVRAPYREWPRGKRIKRSHLDRILKPVHADVLPRQVRENPDRWHAFREYPDGPSRTDELASGAAWYTDQLQAKARNFLRALK